jgi:hypothetical protein
MMDFLYMGSRKRTLTPAQKDILWKKAGKKCEACGIKILSSFDGHTGHKTAFSKGGATHERNLVMLCMICNKNQKTMSWEKFLEKYSKIEPKKFKPAYLKCIKDKKKAEVEKVNTKVSKLKIELVKTNAVAKTKTINNKIDKLKNELLIINEKYKSILGSTKKTISTNKSNIGVKKKVTTSTKKTIKKDTKKIVKKPVKTQAKKPLTKKKKKKSDDGWGFSF